MHFCILLYFLCELYYDARIHEHQVHEVYCFWEKFQVFSGALVLLLSCATVKINVVIFFEKLVVFYQSKLIYFQITIKFGVTR